MRQLLISALIVITTVSTASALDRYPKAKRYVNQDGQVVTIGQAPQIAAYTEVPVRRALPPVRVVPVIETPVVNRPQPRLVTMKPATRSGLLGAVNVDPADWPSGRTCCRPGQPYFNEYGDS